MGWLLVSVSTAGAAAALRMQVWRKLRSLGALYLQQSVCLLPDRPEVAREVRRLLDRVHHQGGTGRLLNITLTEADQAQHVGQQPQRLGQQRTAGAGQDQRHDERGPGQQQRRAGAGQQVEPERPGHGPSTARSRGWPGPAAGAGPEVSASSAAFSNAASAAAAPATAARAASPPAAWK